MMNHPEWEESILDVLGECESESKWPLIGSANLFYGTSALAAYRNDDEWLIVFQDVIYNRQGCWFDHFFCAYGNLLPSNGFIDPPPNLPRAIDEAPGHPLFVGIIGRDCRLDPHHFTLSIHGQPRTFTPTLEDYRAAGINSFENMEAPARILRLVIHQLGTTLFIRADKLPALVGRGDAGLVHLVTLYEWVHPDRVETFAGDSESFQQLAAALAAGDASLIRPTQPANTHWSNWTNMDAY